MTTVPEPVASPEPNVESGAPGDGPTLTFVIGAARSGTTWLASALGADHRIVTPYETHLFNAYVAPMVSMWRSHVRTVTEQADRWRAGVQPPDIAIGLPYVIDEDEFTAILSKLVADVFASIAADNPDALAIVEKTPSHSAHVAEIDRLTGGRARFVHIIRSGYDVVDSTLHAGEGWAAEWAPRDATTAARKWRAGVLGAREAAAFGDRYLELRYEDLLASPAEELLRVMRFVGVDADLDDARRALDSHHDGLWLGGTARQLFDGSFPAPTGFRRAGSARSVRTTVITEGAVGPLLKELGYTRDGSVDPIRRRAWLAAGAMQTTVGRVSRLVRRMRSDIETRR